MSTISPVLQHLSRNHLHGFVERLSLGLERSMDRLRERQAKIFDWFCHLSGGSGIAEIGGEFLKMLDPGRGYRPVSDLFDRRVGDAGLLGNFEPLPFAGF